MFCATCAVACSGVNLNRAWAKPCEDDSPEVFHLLRVMEEKGEQQIRAQGCCIRIQRQGMLFGGEYVL
jgi:hypothetical protein